MLLAGDLAVIGTDAGEGHVYAFERSSGDVRWRTPAGEGATTNIRRLGDAVFAVTLAEELLCLGLDDGRPRWTLPAEEPTAYQGPFRPSPVVTDSLVIHGRSDGRLMALDPADGRRVWEIDLGDRISTHLALLDDDLLCATADGRILRLDPATGAILGMLRCEGKPGRYLTRTEQGLLVFLDWGRPAVRLVCLGERSGDVLWTYRPRSPVRLSAVRPFEFAGAFLVGRSDGGIVALDPDTGETKWTHEVKGAVRTFGSHGDRLFVGTIEGALYALDYPGASGGGSR